MPLYEYQCDNGHRFEKIQKFSDPLVDVCPTCGAPVHKLISSPAIQFKGTGWYITDYAKKDSTAAGKTGESEKAKTDKGGDSAKDSKTETKTESKSETKSETKTETKSESKT
jgi:putative FmdB family regulatory protein